jgi:hypothetical protein
VTQREAKEIGMEVWGYYAAHPECRSKRACLPQGLWDKINKLVLCCPLCEIFGESNCKGCPLYEAGEYCVEDASLYAKWASDRNDTAVRQKAAEGILEIISAWRTYDRD